MQEMMVVFVGRTERTMDCHWKEMMKAQSFREENELLLLVFPRLSVVIVQFWWASGLSSITWTHLNYLQ